MSIPVLRRISRFAGSSYLRAAVDELCVRQAFRSHWTERGLHRALELVEKIDRIFSEAHLSYMAYAGTLLGIARYSGVIPWDDDIDLCLHGTDLPAFLALEDTFRQQGITVSRWDGGWKLFWSDGQPIRAETPWSWPFVDIFVWDKRGSRMVFRGAEDHYPYACLFPLKRAQFHHLQLPVPRDMGPMLAAGYGPGYMTTFLSSWYEHRKERARPWSQVVALNTSRSWRNFLSPKKRPQRVLNEMLLRTATKFLRACGVEFWAEYGTLLGEYRGHSLLAHEADVDLGIREESMPLILGNLKLLPADYEFYDTSYRHDGPKCGIMHRKFGGNCDFYTYRRLQDGQLLICLGPGWRGTMNARPVPEDMIFPLQQTHIDGVSLMRPHRTKDYLLHRYGYIEFPAVMKDDGSSHYRSIWRQDPWVEENESDEPVRLSEGEPTAE
jgi:phosphorylcholine metabolism protein LicD